MSRAESLALELDTAKMELERLRVENAKLRSAETVVTSGNGQQELHSEVAQLRELYEQALRDLQAKQEEIEEVNSQTELLTTQEARIRDLEIEVQREKGTIVRMQEQYEEQQKSWERKRSEFELEKYRALEQERRKWEEREARLVRELEGFQRRVNRRQERAETPDDGISGGDTGLRTASGSTRGVGMTEPVLLSADLGETSVIQPQVELSSQLQSNSTSLLAQDTVSVQESTDTRPASVPSGEQPSTFATSSLEAMLLAQQVPPINKFSGERAGDQETFEEWLDQFELIATACQWTEQAKLVNLATRLKGQAYSFYRACTPTQRAKYSSLVKALKERFTPIHIQAVQSSLFHDRHQGPSETVDTYAQELKRLFYKAYPRWLQAGQETEEMGKSILSSQFVAGLRREIKIKLAGQEGSIDQLLVKARFEEAKLRDLGSVLTSGFSKPTKQAEQTVKPLPSPVNDRPQDPLRRPRDHPRGTCHNCGGTGHYKRQCPYRGSANREARGQPRSNVSTIVASPDPTPGKPADIPTKSVEDTIDKALDETLVTLHGVETATSPEGAQLGPTPFTTVEVEGQPAKTLLDTGSPVSIVSLDFLIKALVAKDEDNPKDVIRERVKQKLEPTPLRLKGYSGEIIPVLKQAKVKMKHGSYEVEAYLQVQKCAPVDLLLGTDLQPMLGFVLMDLVMENPSDLLRPTVDSGDPTKDPPATAHVCLLDAVKIPALHIRRVRVQVQGPLLGHEDTVLFEPVAQLAELTGLITEEGLLPREKEPELFITNPGTHPICLEKGQYVGDISAIDWVQQIEDSSDDNPSTVYHLANQETAITERHHRLLQLLESGCWNIPPEAKHQLQSLVVQFEDVFAVEDSELGRAHDVTHTINTEDNPPIKQRPRRVPFALRDEVARMVDKMLEQGVIQPSKSPWGSPIVLVAKKDGTTRFCVDYRRLNAITKKDVYPLPRIDDTLDTLANNKCFSTLDLASGYWQIAMDESSREKTAFTTHVGLYDFTVMPFGLCNAPATFQRLMESVLHGLIGRSCMVYLDDVLVLGNSVEEHIANLRKVWSRLSQAGLRLKPSKCKLFQKEVKYLGYVVSSEGIATDPGKVTAIQAFPQPADLKSLRSFLGLTSYYRRFIPQFSVVAGPLFALTRKDTPFRWDDRCQIAFDKLKSSLTESPVLSFPQFSRDFQLETDASGEGLGAVLSQEQEDGSIRPVAYASRTLQPHESNYGVTELEALAVVWSVRHFRQYLYGRTCHVYTDHEALKSLLNTPHPSGKLARWGLTLQELDLTIHYCPGKKNAKADALSRYPVGTDKDRRETEAVVAHVEGTPRETSISPSGAPSPADETLADRQRSDPELLNIIQYLDEGMLPQEEKDARQVVLIAGQFTVIDKVLYHLAKDHSLRVVLAKGDRKRLFRETHDGKFGGHLRENKVYGIIERHYWWPGMRKDIASWCRACLTCAARHVGRSVKPPLTPVPVGGPFDRIGVDILQLPLTKRGNKYALVFMDYLTKWPEVFAVRDQTAPTIARHLVEHIITRHGVPAQILSDRGANFLSGLMTAIHDAMGIQQSNTTAYHPQTDGLVERFNRTLLDMLAKTSEEHHHDWDLCLPFVLFAYRCGPQASTMESPFFLLYGRDPRLPTEAALSPPTSRAHYNLDDYKTQAVTRMSDAWQLAQAKIVDAQRRQKTHYDRSAKPSTFRVGDRVFVFNPALKAGKAHKLALPFQGPYRVKTVHETGLDVYPIDRHESTSIRVALDRVRRCPEEVPDVFTRKKHSTTKTLPPTTDGPWSGRLRSSGGVPAA